MFSSRASDLREELEIELESMEAIVAEIDELLTDLVDRVPTVRETTAAASFVAQLYGGLENLLRRILKYVGLPEPTGPTSHRDLFAMFSPRQTQTLPDLFDGDLAIAVKAYRGLRHIFVHAYSVKLNWERMKDSVEQAPEVFRKVIANARAFAATLPRGDDAAGHP